MFAASLDAIAQPHAHGEGSDTCPDRVSAIQDRLAKRAACSNLRREPVDPGAALPGVISSDAESSVETRSLADPALVRDLGHRDRGG